MVEVFIENGNRLRITNKSQPSNLRVGQPNLPLHPWTNEASGSGLGLAIVSNLVEKMNANLVRSFPASGKQDGFEAILTI